MLHKQRYGKSMDIMVTVIQFGVSVHEYVPDVNSSKVT